MGNVALTGFESSAGQFLKNWSEGNNKNKQIIFNSRNKGAGHKKEEVCLLSLQENINITVIN